MKITYIDSNIFIRFLARDIENLYLISQKLFRQIDEGKYKGVVSILVINEILWILENYYKLEREYFIPELIKILSLDNLKILEVKKPLLLSVLQKMINSRIDFTDFYLAEIAGKNKIFSFDRDFEKIYKGN